MQQFNPLRVMPMICVGITTWKNIVVRTNAPFSGTRNGLIGKEGCNQRAFTTPYGLFPEPDVNKSPRCPQCGGLCIIDQNEYMEQIRNVMNDYDRDIIKGRRTCFYIPADGYVEGKGYRVSIVVENESGHFPTGDSPEGGDRMPWYWGKTYEEAKAVCAEQNAKRGLSEEDVFAIITSSMAGPGRRRRRS